MDAVRILARLGPKTSNMESAGISSIAVLTQSDIAASLAGLSAGPELLGWVTAYPDNERDMKHLKLALITEIGEIANSEHWRHAKPGLFGRFAGLAISEVLMPRICMVCNGRSRLIRDDLDIECESCSGTGTRPIVQKDRYKAVQLSRESWRAWRPRYEYIYRVLCAWDMQMREHVSEKLRYCDE